MQISRIKCDKCGKSNEGVFEYFRIERRRFYSAISKDEIIGGSDLCEECYKKLLEKETKKEKT